MKKSFEKKFDPQEFERQGLKIDKERVLTYSQLSCPMDCKYCFAENMNYNQRKDAVYLSNEQFELLEKLPEEINLIMLGCDTEFFQSKEDALRILTKVSELRRDITVVTKLELPENYIRQLHLINERLGKFDKFLTLSISLTSIESALKWEPKASSPERRIITLKKAFESNINTLVSLRPLLPDISRAELEKVVSSTKDYCQGYYSGPLYLKAPNDPLLKTVKESLRIEKVEPHWMPKGNVFYKVEKEGQMEELADIIKQNGKLLFEGAAEAIKHIKHS